MKFGWDKITKFWRQITLMTEFWLLFGKSEKGLPYWKTISQCFKASKTCMILQKSPQLLFGDKVLRYRKIFLVIDRWSFRSDRNWKRRRRL